MSEVEQFFALGGPLDRNAKHYRYRTGQVRMAQEVERVIHSQDEHVFIEGPTGIGKSFAYLVPALLAAAQGKRIVIAAPSINLQEQLINKDIPFLLQALGLQVSYGLGKGMSNYLCLYERDQLREEIVREGYPRNWDAVKQRDYHNVDAWSERTEVGDRNEFIEQISSAVWQRFSTNHDRCLRKVCPYWEPPEYDEESGELIADSLPCHIMTNRYSLRRKQLVVCNYHLLFYHGLVQELTGGNVRLLPRYDCLILDEGHHLPGIANDIFKLRVGVGRFTYLARQLGHVIDDCPVTLPLPLPHEEYSLAGKMLEQMRDDFVIAFSEAWHQRPVLRDFRRSSQAPFLINMPDLTGIAEGLTDFAAGVEDICLVMQGETDRLPSKLLQRATSLHRAACALATDVGLLKSDNEEYVFYVQDDEENDNAVTVFGDILRIGEKLRPLFFDGMPVVITSATLADGKDCRYLKHWCGLEDAQELLLETPFDLEQALFYVPAKCDLPVVVPSGGSKSGPAWDNYFSKCAELITRILTATRGRALVLFTSYDNLNEIYARVSRAELPPEVALYRQAASNQEGFTRQELTRRLRDEHHSVVFGTASFWEGVDVPGSALSCVIVEKIPFEPLDNPIVSFLEHIGDLNSFYDWSMPRAIIKLRQAFGRLLRHEDDRGIFVLCDRRMLRQSYGSQIRAALPKDFDTVNFAELEPFVGQEEG